MFSTSTQIGHSPSNAYHSLLAQAKNQRRLLTLHWELTHRCNERCTHCYLDVLPPQAKQSGELNTADALDVLAQAAEMGVLYLTLSGGEALLRRDFFEIAAAAHAYRFVLRIFTNGVAITPTVATRLAAVRPYAVELSLYGADAQTHEAVTQRPRSFAQTLHACTLLRAQGIRIVLKSPLLAQNIEHVDALRQLAHDYGAVFRDDLTLTPPREGDRALDCHQVRFADLVRHLRQAMPRTAGKAGVYAPGCRLCNVSFNAATLAPNGDLYPCPELPLVAGNLRQTPLRTIWERAPIWSQLAKLQAAQMVHCGACPLGALCNRCHGLALREHGNLRAPSSRHCIQALARRQVLLERGQATIHQLPLSEHLASLLARIEEQEEHHARAA